MFFSFDGIDGSGKTTQIKLFEQWLSDQGHEVVVYRDPGSTELSEMIREILLQAKQTPIGMRAEMMLYMAARTQLVEQKILPAIDAGKTVITDRFVLATVAYQGHGGELPIDEIHQVASVATQGCEPALTFLIDMEPNIAQTRRDRELDRLEQRSLDYHQRVREGFLLEAKADPDRIIVIDGTMSIQKVHNAVVQAARERMDSKG